MGKANETRLIGRAPGEHVCWRFSSREEFWAGVVPCVREGLERGQRVLYLSGQEGTVGAIDVLARAGVEVGEALSSSALVVIDAESAYRLEHGFDHQAIIRMFEGGAAAAAADGFTTLRAIADSSFLLAHATLEALLAYEAGAERMVSASGMIGVCAFDERVCPPSTLRALEAVHGTGGDGSLGFRVGPDGGGVRVEGEVDMAGASEFGRACVAALEVAPEPRLDLTTLRFIDVHGLRALEAGLAQTRRSGRAPTLVGANPTVERCVRLLDLGEIAGALA